MPFIASIHAATGSNTIFPHPLVDLESVSAEMIGFWAIKTLLEKDLVHLEKQNEELVLKMQVAEAEDGANLSEAVKRKLKLEYARNKQSIESVG